MIAGTTTVPCAVRGVRLLELRSVHDALRGHLSVGEIGEELPFQPERFFVTYAIPSGQTRGAHAHFTCAQFLVCVHGACTLRVDDGRNAIELRLDRPTLGIYIPPLVWAAVSEPTADSTLLVLASQRYDPADYIREYAHFRTLVTP